jgi:hypothetical protein
VDGLDARALLSDSERLRRRARADRHPSSVPLLVFAYLTLFGAPLAVARLWPLGQVYWVVAGPAGFLFVAWWYRRQQARSGVGQGRGSYVAAGVAVLAVLLVVPVLWHGPLAAVAAGLLAMAALQRNAYLAAFAAVFGVLGALEDFLVLSNRLADAGLGGELGQPVVYGALGLLLLVGGLVARLREDNPR